MPDRLHLHAARTRDAMTVDLGPKFAGRWTEATHALIHELTDMVAAQHPELPRRFAEFAVSRWITAHRPIGVCIAAELEERLWELPAPEQDRQGFSPPAVEPAPQPHP